MSEVAAAACMAQVVFILLTHYLHAWVRKDTPRSYTMHAVSAGARKVAGGWVQRLASVKNLELAAVAYIQKAS